jgi:hypothetical protein
MKTEPKGSPARDTLPVRVSRPVYRQLAERQALLEERLGRRGVSLCEALEHILAENQLRQMTGAKKMTLMMDDDLISSLDTCHTAHRFTLTRWGVTWLDRETVLTRTQATTAMMMASVIARAENGELTRADPIRGHVESWAAEIGIDYLGAASLIRCAPRWEL